MLSSSLELLLLLITSLPASEETLEAKVNQFFQESPPASGPFYSLRELVEAMCVNTVSPIYQLSPKKVAPLLKSLRALVCGTSTLERRCTFFRKNGVLPASGDDGAAMGRRPLISKENIPELNGNVLENVGMSEGRDDLDSCMSQIVAREREERGLPPLLTATSTFSTHTRLKYDVLASIQPGVARVAASSARNNGIRRQMARFSERNLYANIMTVLQFNFVPGEWIEKPDNLPPGAKLAHNLIERGMGLPACEG